MKTVGIAIWDSSGGRELAEYLTALVSQRKKIDKKTGKETHADPITALELQVEGIYDHHCNENRANWHLLDYKSGFLGEFFSQLSYLSVHAPTRGRNIASLEEGHRAWSVGETKKAMDFAQRINANSFIIHAGRVDNWEDFQPDLRVRNEETFYRSFKELAEHYAKKRPGFNILVENLEAPHLSATSSEHERAYNLCSKILAEAMEEHGVGFSSSGIKMLVDFSHYWNSHITLKENPSKGFVDGYADIASRDIISYLDNFLMVNHQRIGGIHMAGCYNSTLGRMTHAPIMPIARHYDYFELNLKMVLDQVLKHHPEVPIILEVFNTDLPMVLISYQNVVEYFEDNEKSAGSRGR